jgi:3-oxoacyl-[acyl-carrier protein] reductase
MSDGKLALVTGASRGIGKAIALNLAKQGYTVIGTATTDIGATKISTYLESAGFNGKGLRANVACDESVEALYESIIASHGPPGVLVNNAGITRDNLLMRMKPEEWAEVIQTNLSSIFRVSRACIKAMTKARWGRIINISSVVGSSGNGGQTNYSASKAGITAGTND